MKLEKALCALEALILASVLLGALIIQYFKHEQPCPLCFLQRLSMLGVGACVLLNARFAPRKRHYGFAMFFAILGSFIALRQIALHVCPSFPTFGLPFWGLSLYTWSFIVFVCTICYNALLLVIFDRDYSPSHEMGAPAHLAFFLLTLVAFSNIFAALDVCGLSVCYDMALALPLVSP